MIPKVGDRIRLVFTNDMWTSLKPGDLGTVTGVNELTLTPGTTHQVSVSWDDGSSLMMLVPQDRFEVVR